MKAYNKPEIIETELLCADVIATSTVNVSEQAYKIEDGETLTFATSNEIKINPFN
mgnify:FL=1